MFITKNKNSIAEKGMVLFNRLKEGPQVTPATHLLNPPVCLMFSFET